MNKPSMFHVLYCSWSVLLFVQPATGEYCVWDYNSIHIVVRLYDYINKIEVVNT